MLALWDLPCSGLGGVENGIERWSRRLIPSHCHVRCLAAYVLTLDGALIGLQAYLLPDSVRSCPRFTSDALAALFSPYHCVGTMLIYGSFGDQENMPRVGAQVALVDVGIAARRLFDFAAMYVADARGVAIFSESGGLLSEDTLIFSVLPALFETMNTTGMWLATAFFLLMSIALTSSISCLKFLWPT